MSAYPILIAVAIFYSVIPISMFVRRYVPFLLAARYKTERATS